MKHLTIIALLLIATIFSGCYSGFTVAQTGDGKLIAYEELKTYDQGSLSTVWYRGSDDEFHYFVHFIKTNTKYRVRKEEIEIKKEFPRGAGSVHLLDANGEMDKRREQIRERSERNG